MMMEPILGDCISH